MLAASFADTKSMFWLGEAAERQMFKYGYGRTVLCSEKLVTEK
jgi:hypothetical protein